MERGRGTVVHRKFKEKGKRATGSHQHLRLLFEVSMLVLKVVLHPAVLRVLQANSTNLIRKGSRQVREEEKSHDQEQKPHHWRGQAQKRGGALFKRKVQKPPIRERRPVGDARTGASTQCYAQLDCHNSLGCLCGNMGSEKGEARGEGLPTPIITKQVPADSR